MGRTALAITTAGFVVLLLWQGLTLPEAVPGHVGPGGEVTRWSTRVAHLVTGGITGATTALIFWAGPGLVGKLPREFVNLPHKDYWFAPENEARAVRMLTNDLAWVGAATMSLLTWAFWEVGQIARGEQTSPLWAGVVIGAYLVGVIAWAVWINVGPRWKPLTGAVRGA